MTPFIFTLLPVLCWLAIGISILMAIAMTSVVLHQLSGSRGDWPWPLVEVLTRCSILSIAAMWLMIFSIHSMPTVRSILPLSQAQLISMLILTASSSWVVMMFQRFQNQLGNDDKFISNIAQDLISRLALSACIASAFAMIVLLLTDNAVLPFVKKIHQPEAAVSFGVFILCFILLIVVASLIFRTTWVNARLALQTSNSVTFR